jgi:cellulose synthase operon protein YhjQ
MDQKAVQEQNQTPEDVATLYTWANLHGAKYRDFSASRAQTRERARVRVQDAMEQERLQASMGRLDPELEDARVALDAQQVAEFDARSRGARGRMIPDSFAPRQAPAVASPAVPQGAFYGNSSAVPVATPQPAPQSTPPTTWQSPQRHESPSALPVAARAPKAETYVPVPTPERTAASKVQTMAAREEHSLAPTPWLPTSAAENAGRPAWLTTPPAEMTPAPIQPAPEDTLQGSRERLASRWFALKGVFEGASSSSEAVPPPVPSRAPVVAVFSLAGGVGKTSLVATLGRALSAHGERVLLVDTAAFGLLPFYFGAHDQRPGVLRTFTPPNVAGDAPIQMLALDPDTLGPESANQETLTNEVSRHSYGSSRIIIDLATASGATTRRALRLSPTILVPIIPDMNSVVSVSSIDAFFQHNGNAAGAKVLPYYVLNQFDASLPLHLDMREVLRERLGDRMLPFALRRTPVVSEALAEGMTVIDYAPNSTAAEDFENLAGWIKGLAAPASSNYRGVRWSER